MHPLNFYSSSSSLPFTRFPIPQTFSSLFSPSQTLLWIFGVNPEFVQLEFAMVAMGFHSKREIGEKGLAHDLLSHGKKSARKNTADDTMLDSITGDGVVRFCTFSVC